MDGTVVWLFEEIGRRIGHDEVWVASLFYNQVSPSKGDVEKIADILNLSADILKSEYITVYGPGIRDIIHEKFGDGIMSSVDFRCHVDK
ncbi:hypothetical protein EV182_002523, partial [Spiromyces aspiralis]